MRVYSDTSSFINVFFQNETIGPQFEESDLAQNETAIVSEGAYWAHLAGGINDALMLDVLVPMCCTRWHQDDLVGRLLERVTKGIPQRRRQRQRKLRLSHSGFDRCICG